MNLAPNGKPSKLTPEQYRLVRTSAFKKWFGDWERSPKTASKVVDENGEPLVVWHGSQLLFNEFDLSKSLLFGEQTPEVGFHFGTLSQAKERVKSKEEKYFYQCFLNIKNMVETDDMVFFSKHKISLKLKEQGVFTNEEYQNWSKFNSVIKEKGIDGLKYLNKWEGKNYSYMVFYPNQIKLADGTNTTFDSNNNDIRYSDGGNILTDYSNYKTSVIALFNDNKVLILKRGSTANWMPNKWSLVGGVVENDENPKEAIIRESFEEIGLMPKDVVFDNKIYSKDIGEIYYYYGYLESKSVNLDYENSKYEFISQSEVDNYEYVPYVKEYIKKLFSKGFSDTLSSVEDKLDGSNINFDGSNPDVRYKDGGKTRPYVSDDFQIGYNGAYEHLIAPNGKPSNLTPEQYNLVRTSAFKKWFGDWENYPENASKVVDSNGEPLVVYHGTNFEFNEFDYKKTQKNDVGFVGKGFYFTPKKTLALAYAEREHDRFRFNNIGTKKRYKSKVIVKSFFLCIKNPKVIANPQDIGINYYKSEIGDKLEKEKIVKISDNLKKEGYQGVIWHRDNCNGCLEGRKYWEYVTFEPNQIKLADGTNTTFDSKNTDIRFDKGGEINKVTKLMYRDFFTRKFVNNISPNKLNVMRAGAEFSHESRGGDWYEFYAGQKSNFKKEKMGGVGGGKIHKKVISLKNPYYFNSTNSLSESEQTPMLYEKVTKKKFPAIMGTVWAEGKSEKYYSDAEKEIAEKLGKQGYDGVIFIQDGINNDIGKTYIGDIFHFKPELVRFNKGGNLNNFEYSIGGL